MTAESSAKPTIEEALAPEESKSPTPKQTFEGHEDRIWNFIFLHDNVHVVSGSEDGTMRMYNCDTGFLVEMPWKHPGKSIYALALSPDGKTIACGRNDGSVQRWNIDGEMIAGGWTGHNNTVRSLSWSPSGDHLASGSYDGTILIRKTENGRVVVGPITTEQNRVCALAYSPSGDRIASGGYDKTICIWDSETGKRVVGPIKGQGTWVTSLVWSSDSTKLYSASDEFARVFDGKSGEQLHSFKHDYFLNSVALSPKHNVLACVGYSGTAKLWDTESLQPLGQPFSQDDTLYHVSFSPDGHHLAYAGIDNKLTLWSVKDIAPQLVPPILPQQSDKQSIQQETRPNSPSSSCLDADATGGDGIVDVRCDDPYSNFFQTSHQSLPSVTLGSQLPNLFSARRFLNVFSRLHPPADESVPKERSKRKFFARRSKSSLGLATMKVNQLVLEGKAGEGRGKQINNDRSYANDPLSARKDKGIQRDEPPTDAQSPPSDDPTRPDNVDSKDNRNLWKRMMRSRVKDPSDTNIAPVMKCPEVVEVYAVRGFQRFVAMKRVRKSKPLAVTGDVLPVNASSSQPRSSSQVVSIQAGPPSPTIVMNGTQSSQATRGPSLHAPPSHAMAVTVARYAPPSHAVAVNVARSSQAIGGPTLHGSPSRFVTNYYTNHDSDSRSSIEGSCNRFLDMICFPFGRYHNDS
ncbi:WD40-repeat-containing domain protein [Suillus clintonianus]|uniref:WD40-repeat-containing domain protein n=1 Tax=Suillus clintonianus TaxID=1904413 RepID=UPI001B882B59|nr:WD40-repeat-containing domain protein [Suillus clintonianus]KAG2115622.1 WD40-repeat-containing domain protein [Suillus clintonianus]